MCDYNLELKVHILFKTGKSFQAKCSHYCKLADSHAKAK